jgi:hypothetical protein
MDFDKAKRLAPLNQPRPIAVRTDERGRLTAVARIDRRQFTAVETIMDRWRIDDEWWRKEVSRMYYQLVLDGGQVVTIFQDLITNDWFFQNAAAPSDQP